MKLEDIANVYIGVVLKRKEAVYKGTKTNKYKVFNIIKRQSNVIKYIYFAFFIKLY